MTETIDMPFWLKTRMSSWNHVLDGSADPPRGGGNFRGLSGPFESIGNLSCTGRCSIAAKGIIQLPMTSCSRRGHSVCQASANSIMKICGWCGPLAVNGVVGLHMAGKVWYIRLPC